MLDFKLFNLFKYGIKFFIIVFAPFYLVYCSTMFINSLGLGSLIGAMFALKLEFDTIQTVSIDN